MKWRLENVPIPPQHIVGLLLALGLEIFLEQPSLSLPILARAGGGVLIAIGLGLVLWSVREVGALRVDDPNRLIVSGPYAISRNPMYLAWSLLYAGLGLAGSSVWVFATLPFVLLYTHVADVLQEEAFLEQRFGESFENYRKDVPRYF